ncbi:MAG: condensation domain-containing protein, partial [Epibacterium sp.]|nr:condensation domain-containing protein [Epibacterium sp.]NQX75256.1 AMP-binding protein [Epibacterium sp.]
GTQDMIGLFVNTLALRSQLSPDQSFAELLAKTRETLLAAHANQNIPFEQVIDALDLPRSESHAPLVQTLFSMQTLPQSGALTRDLSWQPQPGTEVNARFDLSLNLREEETGLMGYFEYASDLFTRASVERFARRFEHLLEQLPFHLDLPVCDLPLLPDAEQALIADRAARPGDGSQDLWTRVKAQPKTAPAVQVGGSTLSYGQVQAYLAEPAEVGDGIADQLLAALSKLTGAEIDLDGLALTQQTLAQIATVPVPQGTRLEWDGTASGLGLAQAIAALGNGAVLVDDTPGARLVPCYDGYQLCQNGTAQTFLSPAELPLAMEVETTTQPGASTEQRVARPRAGVTAHVLLRSGQHAPIGAMGELCLAGPALARGYVGQPARTAERFQPNPNVDPQSFRVSDACIWRSGRQAKRAPDGTIFLLGRMEDRVQVAGHQVSPSEVEAHLQAIPGVAQAVLLLPHGNRKQLEAVLTCDADTPRPGDSDITRSLLEKLPDYLLPRRLHWLEHIPADASGTPDQQALIRLIQTRSSEDPVGPIETDLAQIWANVLQTSQIRRHDNFFDLGGDSILAMQIVTRMAEAGYTVEPRDLFQHQTIAALAEVAPVQTAQPDSPGEFDLPEIEGLDMDALAGSVSFGD